VGAAKADDGQDGAAGGDGGAGEVDADLGVVADCVFGLVEAAAGGLETLGVQFAGAAGALLGGPLTGARDDLGQAARGGQLAALAVAPVLLDLRVDQISASEPHSGSYPSGVRDGPS
jgi:hypothetical protein